MRNKIKQVRNFVGEAVAVALAAMLILLLMAKLAEFASAASEAVR
jgi:hypothetical protein